MTDVHDTHARPLWRDRRFTTYWSGQTVSQLGDRVSELALPLIAVTTLQASPVEVGVLTAAIWAPNLLSLVVGAWVDHQR
ncbi:MAG: MFS transporter, partial [Lapillicoccus sp.]